MPNKISHVVDLSESVNDWLKNYICSKPWNGSQRGVLWAIIGCETHLYKFLSLILHSKYNALPNYEFVLGVYTIHELCTIIKKPFKIFIVPV